MYATVEHRTVNFDRLEETKQRGEDELFPRMQQAAGFLGFYVVAQDDSLNVAISLWESRAQADAFWDGTASWLQTLEDLGHHLQSLHGGEVIVQVAPK